MRKLYQVVPSLLVDIKKRAAREYSLGEISKDELDTILSGCKQIEGVLPSSEASHKKGLKVNESTKTSKGVNGKAS